MVMARWSPWKRSRGHRERAEQSREQYSRSSVSIASRASSLVLCTFAFILCSARPAPTRVLARERMYFGAAECVRRDKEQRERETLRLLWLFQLTAVLQCALARLTYYYYQHHCAPPSLVQVSRATWERERERERANFADWLLMRDAEREPRVFAGCAILQHSEN